MTNDEGYIKFDCRWKNAAPLAVESIRELNAWRKRLRDLGLIGAYPDGVGYGNISRRGQGATFIISASQTGAMPDLGAEQYSLVTDFDIDANWVQCEGPLRASSESLTHAAAYAGNPATEAVIHVHHLGLWQALIAEGLATPGGIEYGTPAMAGAIFEAARRESRGILAMAGHREGIVSFGSSLDEAGRIVLDARARLT